MQAVFITRAACIVFLYLENRSIIYNFVTNIKQPILP